MEQQEWSRQVTSRIGAELKRLRDVAPKRSAQTVSDETARLGARVSRARIADLEGVNRGGEIKLAEVIMLSAALRVPPLALIFPGSPGRVDPRSPRGRRFPSPAPMIDAALWFSGESTRRASTGTGDSLPEPDRDAGRSLLLGRLEKSALEDVDAAEGQLEDMILAWADSHERLRDGIAEIDDLIAAVDADTSSLSNAFDLVRTSVDEWSRRVEIARNTEYVTKRIIPVIGHIRLEAVRHEDVVAFVDVLEHEGRGIPTVQRILAVLRSALGDAVRTKRLSHNAAEHVRAARRQRDEIRPWTAAQAVRFLDHVNGAPRISVPARSGCAGRSAMSVGTSSWTHRRPNRAAPESDCPAGW